MGQCLRTNSSKNIILDLTLSGLRVPNVQLRINAFYLSHLFKLLNDYKSPWVYFTRY